LIIVEISGGLGNQFFQYAAGRALASKLRCELVLDTSFYESQSLRTFELVDFNINAREATKWEIRIAGGGRGLMTRLIHKIGLAKIVFPKYLRELESFSYEKKIHNSSSGTYLKGYWQNSDYFNSIKNELYLELNTDSPFSSKGKYFAADITNSESVSLHVRRGDYVNDETVAKTHGLCTIEYYKRSILYIKKHIESPVFYIFSDDIPWCKENFKFLSGVTYIENTKDAIEDLQLMKLAKHNIVANSSFSWWGGWLNANPNKVVIAPEDSLKKIPRPDSWIEL
jgi:hypothetical protein